MFSSSEQALALGVFGIKMPTPLVSSSLPGIQRIEQDH